MAMEFLPFDKQLVPELASNDQNDDLITHNIVQGTQVFCSQFELCEGIGAQAFDGFRGGGRRSRNRERIADSRIRCSRTDKDRNCRSASSVMGILNGMSFARLASPPSSGTTKG
jgi:hypothetical protein